MIDLSALPYRAVVREHEAISAEFLAAMEAGTDVPMERWHALAAYQDEHAARLRGLPSGPVGISWISEYGLTQKLSNTILCF